MAIRAVPGKIRSPRLLTLGALVINVLLLAFLTWHIAFEAVPGAIAHVRASLSNEGRALAMLVLLPYLLVLVYLARRLRQCVFEWKTAASVVAAMVVHVVLVVAVTAYAAWRFMPG